MKGGRPHSSKQRLFENVELQGERAKKKEQEREVDAKGKEI